MRPAPDYEVAIVGAGPAGAWAVKHLPPDTAALLLDAEDRLAADGQAKLCGGMLTEQAQRLLPELPLEVRAEPFTTRIEYHDLDNRIFGRMPVGYANCHRKKLDHWLLETALAETRARIEYRPRTRLLDAREEDGQVRLALDGAEATARCLLDCSGWRAAGRRAAGAPPAPHLNAVQAACKLERPYPYYISIFRSAVTPFFGWFIPKSGEEGAVGAAFPPDVRGSGAELLAPFLEHLQVAGLALTPVSFRGCRLSHPRYSRELWLGAGCVLACGEAAGLVSPSSGDGISYALASGKAAAEALRHPPQHLLRAYRQALRPELAELRRNMVKARLLARPGWRRVAAALLLLTQPAKFRRLSL